MIPASEREKAVHVLDRAATVTVMLTLGFVNYKSNTIHLSGSQYGRNACLLYNEYIILISHLGSAIARDAWLPQPIEANSGTES
jgi:hypothetical protein